MKKPKCMATSKVELHPHHRCTFGSSRPAKSAQTCQRQPGGRARVRRPRFSNCCTRLSPRETQARRTHETPTEKGHCEDARRTQQCAPHDTVKPIYDTRSHPNPNSFGCLGRPTNDTTGTSVNADSCQSSAAECEAGGSVRQRVANLRTANCIYAHQETTCRVGVTQFRDFFLQEHRVQIVIRISVSTRTPRIRDETRRTFLHLRV